jgi:hypothetical protein
MKASGRAPRNAVGVLSTVEPPPRGYPRSGRKRRSPARESCDQYAHRRATMVSPAVGPKWPRTNPGRLPRTGIRGGSDGASPSRSHKIPFSTRRLNAGEPERLGRSRPGCSDEPAPSVAGFDAAVPTAKANVNLGGLAELGGRWCARGLPGKAGTEDAGPKNDVGNQRRSRRRDYQDTVCCI